MQNLFEETDSDVLLLYDCGYSPPPAIRISSPGVAEVIAASGFETRKTIFGATTFTRTLTRILIEACRGPPFSVAKLHEMVLRSLQSSSRDFLKDEYGEVVNDSSRCPVLQRQPNSTPIYCFLKEERPHRGILLSPLPARLLQRVRGTSSTNFDGKYSACDE
jgi:hypothetical protein